MHIPYETEEDTHRLNKRAVDNIEEDERTLDTPESMMGRFRMKFRVLIEPDEDGVFVPQCPTLPGCISQGRTRAEAEANIRDAITGYLESLKKHSEPVPPTIYEEIIEVAV